MPGSHEQPGHFSLCREEFPAKYRLFPIWSVSGFTSQVELYCPRPPLDYCPKSVMTTNRNAFLLLLLFAAVFLLSSGSGFGQTGGCSQVPVHELMPAEAAYQQGKYEIAESLYQQALLQKPNDPDLNSAVVRTLLHEGRISDAWTRANKGAEVAPRSAAALTALAEVQLRKGQPWLASQTLDSASAVDPCYARVHLIRGRIFRIDSMYASERAEIKAAYLIDPNDPDIHRAWAHTVNPANDIVRIDDSLASTANLDPEIREKALASANSLRSQLSENSQTCQSSPVTTSLSLPLLASYENAKKISGYKLEVEFPKAKVKLVVDTAASGLYISQKLADTLGLQQGPGAPANTVRADTLRIGSLEFHNCTVGVSDTPFADRVDGFIGTDVFASYLITLNHREEKLELDPLPHLPGEAKNPLPGDRYNGPEVRSFTPVYHKNQYVLVPVMLNRKERRLFVLDTGMRMSTMTSEAAHSVSNTRLNFTNSVKTVSGSTLQIYRDGFDLQFANLSFDRKDHILEFDPSAIDQNAGLEVAGMLGFDILQPLVIHIDYRDGLVQFDSANSGLPRPVVASVDSAASSSVAGNAAACTQYAGQNAGHPISSAVRATIVDGLDSGRLKPGHAIRAKMVSDWVAPFCTLSKGAFIYGHVVAASAQKNSGAAELAVVFDHGDCVSHPKQELLLRVISLEGDETSSAVHNAMPTQVRGGARAISDTASSMGSYLDEDMRSGRVVHPGEVTGLKHLKLIPEGGPQCSAMLTSEERSVNLDSGTEFIMTMQALPE
jgi:tetratricopeptide (TPR) repeat protein